MRHIPKGLTVILVINLTLLSLSFTIISASCADPPAPTAPPDIPVPSVPEFTLTYADYSYDVPAKTTSSTDPYTGKVTNTTTPGYHVKNRVIDVSIKNQPYPPTINNGNVSTLKYFIQVKGHFEPESSFWVVGDGNIDGTNVVASNSDYTVVSISLGEISEGAIDFRAKTSLGYNYTYFYGLVPFNGWASADSNWSAIQTFTLNEGSVSPSPSVPEFTAITILPLLIAGLLSVAIIRKKQASPKTTTC
jgi:hypothetical protein